MVFPDRMEFPALMARMHQTSKPEMTFSFHAQPVHQAHQDPRAILVQPGRLAQPDHREILAQVGNLEPPESKEVLAIKELPDLMESQERRAVLVAMLQLARVSPEIKVRSDSPVAMVQSVRLVQMGNQARMALLVQVVFLDSKEMTASLEIKDHREHVDQPERTRTTVRVPPRVYPHSQNQGSLCLMPLALPNPERSQFQISPAPQLLSRRMRSRLHPSNPHKRIHRPQSPKHPSSVVVVALLISEAVLARRKLSAFKE